MTMDPKEIERNSCIYDISKLDPGHKMWLYFNEMNKAAMNLARYKGIQAWELKGRPRESGNGFVFARKHSRRR